MAVDKLVDSTQLDADLTSVANAIRTKGGTSAQMAFPSGFVSAVQAIPTGGVTPTGTKNITANGTGIDVYSYQYADVAVPNSYSQSDEGKVVSNGALVAQSSDTVTTNDTYDTTLINSLTVNVSGGGGYSIDDILNKNITENNLSWTGSTLTKISLNGNPIKNISFPNATNLDNSPWAFGNMTQLVSFSAPNMTISSSSNLFNGDTALTTLNLPNVSSLSGCDNLAQGCTSLTSVNLDKCDNMGGNTFNGCTSLQCIVLPKCTVLYISNFYNCSALKTFDGLIGNNIGQNCFNRCTVLDTIIIRRTNGVATLSNINAFNNSPFASGGSGGTIYVPNALIASYQSASNWSTILGYANNQIKKIEDTIYETKYADGRNIS